MTGTNKMWKFIYTSSGGVYVYLTETNQIFTVQIESFDLLSKENFEDVISDELYNRGLIYGMDIHEIIWPHTIEEYYQIIKTKIPGLVLEITQQCTLRCEYCIYSGNYSGIRTHQENHMDKTIIMQSIDYYAQHNVDYPTAAITFYGGEALIDFESICFAVDYAREKIKKKPLSFHISSNGTTLNDNVIKWLLLNEDVSVTITLNGSEHDQYRKFASGTGSLNCIMNTLNDIRTNNSKLWNRIDFIANVVSFSKLLSLREFYLKYIEKPPLMITGIYAIGGNETIQIIVNEEEKDNTARDTAKRLYCETNDPYISPFYQLNIQDICVRSLTRLGTKSIRSTCCMPFTTALFVSFDGMLGICEKVGTEFGLGRIEDGINIEAAETIMNEVLSLFNQNCRTCWVQRFCNVCFQDFQRNSENVLLIPEEVCEHTKQIVGADLELFCEIGEKNTELIDRIQKEYFVK